MMPRSAAPAGRPPAASSAAAAAATSAASRALAKVVDEPDPPAPPTRASAPPASTNATGMSARGHGKPARARPPGPSRLPPGQLGRRATCGACSRPPQALHQKRHSQAELPSRLANARGARTGRRGPVLGPGVGAQAAAVERRGREVSDRGVHAVLARAQAAVSASAVCPT